MDCEQVRDNLDAHLLGALDAAESKSIEEHLRGCDLCRQYLTEAINAMEALRALPGLQPRENYAERILSSHHNRKKFFLSMFGVIVLLLVLVICLVESLSQYRKVYPQYHLKVLETGIYKYCNKHHFFPPDIMESLLSSEAGAPYISREIFKTDTKGAILDIWKSPYIYRYPGIYNTSSFDLYSCGPNRIDEQGRGDDVKNWKFK